MWANTKENRFQVLEWIIFLALCCLSFYFMKGVLEQYFSNDTSFKHSEVMLKERPTIVICFTSIIENDQKKHFTSKYVLGKDFNITYQHENLIIGQEQKTKNVKEVETVILEKLPNTGSYGTLCNGITNFSHESCRMENYWSELCQIDSNGNFTPNKIFHFKF